MKLITHRAFYLLVMTTLLLGTFVSKIVYADSPNTNVNATVKISVCGNNLAEGGEDCDNSDLKGKTCQSFGYSGGALSCDISCSYDTTSCIVATPAPTIFPTPTSMPNSAATTTVQLTSQPQTNPTDVPVSLSPTHIPTPLVEQNTFFSTFLPHSFPQTLRYLGATNDGFIPHEKLRSSVQLWVTNWKNFISTQDTKKNETTTQTSSKCDLNGDHICDLTDFSIMLYYVKK